MKTETLSYTSSDKKTGLNAHLYLPDDAAKGIVQIITGTEDAPARYDPLTAYLAEHGYACAVQELSCDYLADAEAPDRLLMEDTKLLRDSIREKYPELPHFCTGFGEGSYLLRAFLAQYGDGFHGAVLAGTGYVSPGIGSMRIYGKKVRSLFRGTSARKQEAGDRALMQLAATACSESHFDKLPKNLSVLLVSGAEDPAGDRGAGVRRVQERMLQAGMPDITCKLYPDVAGDLLDAGIRDTFLSDLCAFLDARPDKAFSSSYASNRSYMEKKVAEQKDYEIDQILI